MKKELRFWQFAALRLKRDEPVMLLVVAESEGSSPGRPGFKMLIARDDLAGSIGGGVMEVGLVEHARVFLDEETRRQGEEEKRRRGEEEKRRRGDRGDRGDWGDKEKNLDLQEIRNPKSEIRNRINPKSEIQNRINPKSEIRNPKSNKSKIQMVHRKNSPNSSGMICSGEQTVILFELRSAHLKTVKKIISALEDHQSKILQISDFKFQISDSESDGFDFRFEQTGEDEFLYQERLGCKNKLFIIGGGHCALALSELMSKMDFYISLFDDRADLNTLAKNKFVDRKTIIDSYRNIGQFIESGENVYVVVMTLGYKFDEIVIRQLFDKKFKYFGVLGSRAKMKTLLRDLEKEGFDHGKLGQIHTPIGLKINSRTPEEIAVSIAAEIIAVKNS